MKLDDVEWASLPHAYGDATDTPGRLRDVTDPDPKVRAEARFQLDASLAHQGNRYEASVPAVPFLIAALDAEHVDRPQTLDLLSALANGDDGDWWLTGHPPRGDASGFGALEKRVYDEVVKGMKRYVAALEDPDAEVRSSAAHLLTWLGTEAKATRSAIAKRVVVEKDAPALASAILALAYLGDASDIPAIRVQQGDPRREVRDAAAVALLHLGVVDGEVIGALGAILREAKRTLHWWDLRPLQLNEAIFGWPLPNANEGGTSPWGPLSSMVSAHLPDLAASRPNDVLALWVALREGDTDESGDAGLHAIGAVAAPGADVELRRRLLTTYALRDEIWSRPVADELAKHRLPDRPQTLRADLGLPPRDADVPHLLRGREQPAGDAVVAAIADGTMNELVDELASLPVTEAWSIARAWSWVVGLRPASLRDVALRLAKLDDIEAVVEADALAWRRAGALPIRVDEQGRPLIAVRYAELAVEVGIARAEGGHVPRPWFEATAAWLIGSRNQDVVIRALRSLPLERRVAVVRWAMAKEAYDVMETLAPLAPVPEVIEPTVERLAAWGKGSQIDRYDVALAAFGPAVLPYLDRVIADDSRAAVTRKTFAAARQRIAPTEAASAEVAPKRERGARKKKT